MFRDAVSQAIQFTLPVIISFRTVGGTCQSGSGTCVVVNDEGWIVTAAHLLKHLNDLHQAEAKTRALEAQVGGSAGGQADKNLNRKERRKRAALGKGPLPTDIDRWSVWWGRDGWIVDPQSVTLIEPADIAVARIDGFDPKSIAQYPTFKDPKKGIDAGTSLCRLGFPFYRIESDWDAAAGRFQLKNSPPPIFPNEGILSRMTELVLVDPAGNVLPPPPFPLKMIETSSAGIRGQSGGPIFDQHGTVWGIQSATTSYEMDLNTAEKQYYHVGVGVHVETIMGLFETTGIKFAISTY